MIGNETTTEVLGLLQSMARDVALLRSELAKQGNGDDEWKDAKRAAKYMCVSASTFDKYRYNTTPRLKGYPIDGKTLYKTSDLDNFVILYGISTGKV